jgi:parallel beta-helix repeat protein
MVMSEIHDDILDCLPNEERGITRRSFLKGAAAFSTAALFNHWTGAPVIRAVRSFLPLDNSVTQAEVCEADLLSAVPVYVGDDLQAMADNHPEGTVFLLKYTDRDGQRGVHRLQQVVPKDRQQFIGEREADGRLATVMNGATILAASAWQQRGSLYCFENPPIQTGGRVIAGRADGSWRSPIARPEDLFITDYGDCTGLKRVKTLAEVAQGKTWVYDEDQRVDMIQAYRDPDSGKLGFGLYDWAGESMTDKWTGIMSEGAGALAWLVGDVDGDGRAEVIQPWDDNGVLAAIVYGWEEDQLAVRWSGNLARPSETLQWFAVDVDGDRCAELVQVRAVGPGRELWTTLYGWRDGSLKLQWEGKLKDGLGGTPTLAWFATDVDNDGRAELVHVRMARPSRVLFEVYDWQDGQLRSWTTNVVDRDLMTLAWLHGDIDGDGRVELIQVWDQNGWLSLRVYAFQEWHLRNPRWYEQQEELPRWEYEPKMVLRWESKTGMRQGSGYVDLLMGDVNDDGTAELVQLWENSARPAGERLAALVYAWRPMHRNSNGEWVDAQMELIATGDLGQPVTTSVWSLADVNDDGRVELVQAQEEAGQTHITVFGFKDGSWSDGWNPYGHFEQMGQAHKTALRVDRRAWLAADVDRGAHRKLYMADDPAAPGRVVELSLQKFAFGYHITAPGLFTPDWPLNTEPLSGPHPDIYSPTDLYADKPSEVRIQHLIIEKYANPAQTGAVGYFRPGNDWQILNNEVRFNHGSGIKAKGAAMMRGNHLHHNGHFGMEIGDGNRTPTSSGGSQAEGFQTLEEWGFNGGYAGRGALVDNNVLEHNNRLGFEVGWGAGGVKFSQCFDLTVRHNQARQNAGTGFWFDFCYSGMLIDGNFAVDNTGKGIFYETSFDATIVNNTATGNGADSDGFGAQIYLSSCENVAVYENLVRCTDHGSSGHGIMVVQSNNGPVEPTRTVEEWPMGSLNHEIYHNTVVFPVSGKLVGAEPMHENVGPQAHTPFWSQGNIRFYDNLYICEKPWQSHNWRWQKDGIWAGNLQFAQFQRMTEGVSGGSRVDGRLTPTIIAAGANGRLYRYTGDRLVSMHGWGRNVDGGLSGNGIRVSSRGSVYRMRDFGPWRTLKGCRAQDAAATYDGRLIYACGRNNRLYWYDQSAATFRQLAGSPLCRRVGVDDNLTPWIVGTDGRVYRYTFETQEWSWVPGCIAQDVGCGGGQVYACGVEEALYKYNPVLEQFEEIQGLGVRIAVDTDGTAWHVNSAGMLWRNTPDRGWVRVPSQMPICDIGL